METTLSNQSTGPMVNMARSLVFSILKALKDCGLTIHDGENQYFFGDSSAQLQATVHVHNRRIYRRVLAGGSIGVAEAFVEQDWTTPDLLNVIRMFVRNQAALETLEKRLGWITWPVHRLAHVLNRNSRSGSRTNIAAHYDLGNDLYQLILDPHMQYSSGIFETPQDSLEQAQVAKLETICRKLDLQPGDHVIEIGTGWGGLACYMARHYQCRVTTTTLSREQHRYAQQMVREQGLEDRVTLLLEDYRDLSGQYDKLVSVEMIEAVGYRFLPAYFAKLESLLKTDGRMLIQAITIADQQFDQYRRGVDFIQRYIFPGGCLPSISEMCHQLKTQTSMTLTRLTDHGHDYAETLACWHERFANAAGQLSRLGYAEDFQRLWSFYFAYCEGGFREGAISLVHFEAAKPGARICAGSGYSS